MARTFRATKTRRTVNRAMSWMIRRGLVPGNSYLLTVVGRTSGQPRTVPVTLIENADGRWLVAPYGVTQWVRNVRAAGQATLERRRQIETVLLSEVGPVQAAPVLQEYLREVPIVRPYFDVRPDSPLPDFEAEADRHPVFEIHGPVAA
jgi:deazaflavin-dependent oxidoreductase (nitroreductase family)